MLCKDIPYIFWLVIHLSLSCVLFWKCIKITCTQSDIKNIWIYFLCLICGSTKFWGNHKIFSWEKSTAVITMEIVHAIFLIPPTFILQSVWSWSASHSWHSYTTSIPTTSHMTSGWIHVFKLEKRRPSSELLFLIFFFFDISIDIKFLLTMVL